MKTVTIYTDGGGCFATPDDVQCSRPWQGKQTIMTASAIGGKLL